MNNLLTQPLIISFLISALTTPLVISYFKKKGWLDDPKQNKHPKVVHKKAVPRGGGISVFLAIALTALFLLPLDKHLISILLAALLATAVGVRDDIKEVSPYLRLGTNILVALIIVLGGIGINYITNPFDTVFHLDQFMIGSFAIIIGLLSLKFSQDIAQWPVITLSGAVAGSYLGLLVFNAYPQKIIPGYSGKSLAGLMLGILAILSGAKCTAPPSSAFKNRNS